MRLHAPRFFRSSRYRALLVLAALAGLVLPCGRTAAAPETPQLTLNEYQIKAAAFYNIIVFTNWPDSAFTGPDAPLVIGIVGHGPIASIITALVRNETWRGRKVTVVQYADRHSISSCHVLFVAGSERSNWEQIRAECSHRPILAISDGENFAAQGGNVQLSIEQKKLHILINLATTRASGLQLSSNLLHLATIVGPQPDSMEAPHLPLQIEPTRLFSQVLATLP